MTYRPAILPRPRRVTISQVAEAAGVARATAAFVISGRAPELRIAHKAIDRVNAVAKKLGYVPNQLARGMITGRSHVVGVILGGVWGKFGQYVIEAVREVLDAQGYLPFLTIHSWSEHRERRELDMLMRMRVDGVIAMPQITSRKECDAEEIDQLDWGQRFAKLRGRPDGLVSLNDNCGLKMLHSLRSAGVDVPGDVKIGCLGDTIETVEQSAQLTAIREPIREIGRAAAQLVIEAIEKPKLRPQERLIEAAELVVRSSTVGVAGSVR